MYRKVVNKKITYYYYENGIENKSTILFLPGYADSGLMYAKLARSLDHKYRVLALDLPMIRNNSKIYNLDNLTEYISEFVNALQLTNFTLAAFSALGFVAINYTYYNQDKVNNLILLNSTPRFILSKLVRSIYLKLKPLFLLKGVLFVYSRLNTSKNIRRLVRSPRISRFTVVRMRNFYYSVFGTAANLIGESQLIKFKKIKINKKIVFFKDDTIIPWDRYQDFVEKLNCEVVVFSEGLHADKKIYWEKLKTLWLKSPKIDFQNVNIEKQN